MFRSSLRRLLAPRILTGPSTRLLSTRPLHRHLLLLPLSSSSPSSSHAFSTTPPARIKTEGHFPKELYESIAEGTLEGILMSLEILSEQRQDIDVEYSAGVLTLTTPKGTYVINKQPPNRQLWLSSPVSGPFRYDWDHIRMMWVSAKRDGGTLSGLLRKEVGIEYDISIPITG